MTGESQSDANDQVKVEGSVEKLENLTPDERATTKDETLEAQEGNNKYYMTPKEIEEWRDQDRYKWKS